MIDAIRHQSITKYSTILSVQKSTQIHLSNFCSQVPTGRLISHHNRLWILNRESPHYFTVGHRGQKVPPAKMSVGT